MKSRALFHIGCDWGTSSSKIVVRDLSFPGFDHGRAHPVLHERGGGTPRFPSTVALERGRLWFGFDAEERRGRPGAVLWDSLKAQAGVGSAWGRRAVGELTLQDLVTLSLTQLMGIAQDDVINPLAEMRRVTPVTRATVSVPTQELETKHRRYLHSTLAAMRLALFDKLRPSGQTVTELVGALREAESVIERVEKGIGMDWDQYLRPESMAAMLWLHRLPQVGNGAYCLVDVGAATVHASFFRIHDERDPGGTLVTKGGLSLFGGCTDAVGMDRVGQRLMELRLVPSVAAARGREQDLLRNPRVAKHLKEQLDAMRLVWRDADRAARQKEMISPLTRKPLNWLVVGGGGQVLAVRSQFSRAPDFNGKRAKGYLEVRGSVQPDDLFIVPTTSASRPRRYQKNAAFLMVAYGLSFPRDHCPALYLPSGVRAMDYRPPIRHLPDADELYSE